MFTGANLFKLFCVASGTVTKIGDTPTLIIFSTLKEIPSPSYVEITLISRTVP